MRPAATNADWRLAALCGKAAGLGLAPVLGPADPRLGLIAMAGAVAAARWRPRLTVVPTLAWLVAIGLLAGAGGLALAGLRLAAIDAGALDARPGRYATARGFVTAVPRRADGEVSVRIQTADGRLLVVALEPVPDLSVGREVEAAGVIRDPDPWQAAYLRIHGVSKVLEARRLVLTGARRGGLAGLADRVRDRAEVALERGMPDAEAALARGFVLGQDDRIDPATVDDFKRSGLAHLLAVSGQNVLLLGLLAIPLLALLGVPLRARLAAVLALIAVYVPVTGAGPSIQRAGVMGAAGLAAVLAGRPRARWYALALAAFATLAVNPRAAADVGWQLSFAAVAGILMWAGAVRGLLLSLRRGSGAPGPVARTLAEGGALTISATVATAPLMTHHFEAVSLAAIPANLLALPAVAPVMWLGMLAAMAGQLPALPVEPLNELNSLLIAYVAQVADWLSRPRWSQAEVHLSAGGVVAAYAGLLCAGWCLSASARRRGTLGIRVRRRRLPACAALALVAPVAAALGAPGPEPPAATPHPELEVSVLDVGQGDAILLEPEGADPLLVDGGPPGEDLVEQLDREGVERLGLVVLSHDSLDHSGGVEELLGAVPVGRFAYGIARRQTLASAEQAGARLTRIHAGSSVRSGRLRIDVLWPPRELTDATAPDAEEVNRLSAVLLVRWEEFEMLLTADAEAEQVPIDPGPIDVLKVAHHGSEDAGLAGLLERALPRLAVISVGADNSYGHPAPGTIEALARHRVPVLRTDLSGPVQIEVSSGAWTVRPGVT